MTCEPPSPETNTRSSLHALGTPRTRLARRIQSPGSPARNHGCRPRATLSNAAMATKTPSRRLDLLPDAAPKGINPD